MPTYIEHVNARLRERIATAERLVVFGQNITAGSHLAGLTRGFAARPGSLLMNTPNIENTLIGVGFGVMLRGQSAIFFCKQQDFLLLGLDHIVNTYSAIRGRSNLGSFTIVSIVVDSGFEGPQSALNNLSDFCSLAHAPGYLIACREDADGIIAGHLVTPGFRFIGVSQRLFRTELLSWPEGTVSSKNDGDVFCYESGDDATVVAFNLALPQAATVTRAIRDDGGSASLYSVNNVGMADWTPVLNDVARTRRLVVIDDSKSCNRQSDRFVGDVREHCALDACVRVQRRFTLESLSPNADRLDVDTAAILAQLKLKPRAKPVRILAG
jgi:pyruvate/2-oxoglutarate/acetoin dehydrogenase E1 component